jgi:hypothetical protein
MISESIEKAEKHILPPLEKACPIPNTEYQARFDMSIKSLLQDKRTE